MKGLTYMEKKMLIIRHLKDGYTYQEAIQMIRNDCESIRTINTKKRIEKKTMKDSKKMFDKEFKELKNDM